MCPPTCANRRQSIFGLWGLDIKPMLRYPRGDATNLCRTPGISSSSRAPLWLSRLLNKCWQKSGRNAVRGPVIGGVDRLLARAAQSCNRELTQSFFQERDDFGLFGWSQFLESKLCGPHLSIVEFGFVAETERGVAGFEFQSALEKTNHISVLCVSRHAVPGSWCEIRRIALDNGMKLFGQRAIMLGHLGYFCEQRRFAVLLAALQFLDMLAHGGVFLFGESS